MVDTAEKDASDVLRSLLLVERQEKTIDSKPVANQPSGNLTAALDVHPLESGDHVSSFSTQSWHHSMKLYSDRTISEETFSSPHNQVMWENLETGQQVQSEYNVVVTAEDVTREIDTQPKPQSQVNEPRHESSTNTGIKPIKQDCLPPKKKKKKLADLLADGYNPTRLEDNAEQVRERFSRGCECQEDNCFKGLNPEFVYRHRLNIAELTKAEHDMYLMGVTMACLANPEETVRHKERKRLRARYVFQGKEVCLDAFLYLENCTHYQLKRIRKHVMTHGVTPRIHGNHGKKPHNTFSLDIYQHATAFLQHYIQNTSALVASGNHQGSKSGSKGTSHKGKTAPVNLPQDVTRKKIHVAYREYCDHFEPNIKVMGYSTFRHFMKEQFPHVRFAKPEPGSKAGGSGGGGEAAGGAVTSAASAAPHASPISGGEASPPSPPPPPLPSQQQTLPTTTGTIIQQVAIPVVVATNTLVSETVDASSHSLVHQQHQHQNHQQEHLHQREALNSNYSQPAFVMGPHLALGPLSEQGTLCELQQVATVYQPTQMAVAVSNSHPATTYAFTSM